MLHQVLRLVGLQVEGVLSGRIFLHKETGEKRKTVERTGETFLENNREKKREKRGEKKNTWKKPESRPFQKGKGLISS